MSQENVEIVRGAYAAFNRHDLVYESNARTIQLGLRVVF